MDVDPLLSSSPITGQAVSTDAPRHMPSFSTSRRSSGRGTPSSFAPSTPPPLPDGDYAAKEGDPEDDLGPLDPRRLTPNLHANLVSEILALRREVESKNTFIDRLEGNFASVKSENESLEVQLAKKSKETRAIKRQLQSIEDGTLSALEELCKERDEANDSVVDLKKRLEASQKQLRAEQDRSNHAQKLWDEEKLMLEQENRVLQRKTGVAEGRLKAVMEELVATQPEEELPATDNVSDVKDFAPPTDALGSLPSSPTKVRSHVRNRSSVSTIGSPQRKSFINGASLADELGVDADDAASDGEVHENDDELVLKNRDRSELGYDDFNNERDLTHLSNINESDQSVTPGIRRTFDDVAAPSNASGRLNDAINNAPKTTWPYSAQRNAQDASIPDELGSDAEADLRRKRYPEARKAGYHSRTRSEPVAGVHSFTMPSINGIVNQALISPQPAASESGGSGEDKTMTSSSSTQTELDSSEVRSLPTSTRASPPARIAVPHIAIHPPESEPSSPSDTVLPPQTRSASTQTDLQLVKTFRSTAVQTDVIRVDTRRFALPPHLLPSALNTTSEPSRDLPRQPSSAKVDGENSARALSPLPSPADPDQSEMHPLDQSTEFESMEPSSFEANLARLRKAFMTNSTQTRMAEADPFQGNEEAWMNEGEYVPHAPPTRSMKRTQKLAKPFDPPTPVPEDEKVVISQQPGQSAGGRNSLERAGSNIRTNGYSAVSMGKHGRRISDRSGSPSSRASSSAWSRSTGPPAGVVIPQRTSSVSIRHGKIEGRSASSPTRGPNARRIGKPPMLRKIRSASVISSDIRNDPSRGLPLSPFSQVSFASGETSPAPVPEHSVLQIYRAGHQRSSSSQTRRLSGVVPTGNASVGNSVQHSVVDAIAATMVGEWMWKYVRRRKSFGIHDASQDPPKHNEQRHKRWVWLSPYERTVMWSTKQPTSNTALMGKSGRKMVIQSVLDVKDDNMVSKSAPHGVFNRSILILTPTRALKFTATSRERHYLWLTALSFLAHHTSQGSLDLSFLPLSTTATPHTEVDPNVSHNTSATASRSGRKPWSSRTTNRSQQSSGYQTPSIPEASVSAEGGVNPIPPRPSRPAPQAPQPDILPSDTALPPNVPRVAGSRNTSAYFGLPTKHARKRSASITGVMSLSSRPSSRRLQASGTTANRSYPNTATSNSSNHSTKSGINDPATSTSRNVTISAAPPPAVPTIPSATSGTGAKTFGAPSGREPTTPVRDDTDTDPVPLIPVQNFGMDGTRNFDWATIVAKGDGDATTEFGGNNNFFDAVGADMGPTGTGVNVRRADAFSGPGFERIGPPKRPPPTPPGVDASPDVSQNHGPSSSVDSVAPPPIRLRGAQSPEPPVPAVPLQYKQLDETVAAEKPTAKKPYNPPQRKLPRWGLGKNAGSKKQANGVVPNVASIVATIDSGENKENIA